MFFYKILASDGFTVVTRKRKAPTPVKSVLGQALTYTDTRLRPYTFVSGLHYDFSGKTMNYTPTSRTRFSSKPSFCVVIPSDKKGSHLETRRPLAIEVNSGGVISENSPPLLLRYGQFVAFGEGGMLVEQTIASGRYKDKEIRTVQVDYSAFKIQFLSRQSEPIDTPPAYKSPHPKTLYRARVHSYDPKTKTLNLFSLPMRGDNQTFSNTTALFSDKKT